MNSKKSTDSFYKRLIPVAASTTKPDDAKKIQSSAHHSHSKNNTSDTADRHISSISNISSPLGRGAIDGQTYIDVQSNGLTQRIVRYEEENRKTPSLYNRAYKRAGDFPIVHLDKSKVVLTPKRNFANPPKIAKIGQPDPCINSTSARAEILRNGTMTPAVSLDRREDVDNGCLGPLDALKEISRKRIHCEDAIDPIQPTIEKDATDSNQSPICNNSKRQRIASVNSPSSNETGRRNNSKCNEILSSLSSSTYMVAESSKRTKIASRNSSISPPQAKRLQTEQPTEAPIIDTTAVVSVPKPVKKIVPEVAEKTYPTEPPRPKLTLFNRPYSATASTTLPRVNTSRKDECNISFVKPRPMTERSRESVENWLKVKPDDKRRLSLMLKCLSGEVDDDSDAVDSGGVNEIPKTANPIAETTKPLGQDKNATEKSVDAIVATQDIVSKPSTVLPTKPTVTFNPISTNTAPLLPPSVQPPATIVQPPAQIVQPPVTIAAASVEERKGGFSFPLSSKETITTPIVTAPSAIVLPTPPIISSSVATPSVASASSPSIVPKDPLPALNPSVSFTFHPSKPKASSPVVTTVEPTKAFAFGTVTTSTNSTLVFGTSAPPAGTAKLATNSTLEEPKKTASFAAFGQTASTAGNINFGTNLATSTAPPSNTFAFGSIPYTTNKAQPPTFGSIQTTTQQPTDGDKNFQSNKTSTFSTNAPISAFGSTLSTTTTTKADPRTSNIATTSASTQAINSAFGSGSFVFGATTNSAATIKPTQPTLPSASSFISAPNIFHQQQTSATTSIFGTPATTTTSLFQTPNVTSIKGTEQEKNVAAPNIFGSSSATKPTSNFAFASTNQTNANNVFGSKTSANSGNTFTFGGSVQKPDSSSSFTFGGNNIETKSVAFGVAKSVAPTFGTANVIDSTKSIGFTATNQASSTNLFTNPSTINEVPKVFSFGGTNNPLSTNAAAPSGGTSSTYGPSTAFGGAVSAFGSTKATPSFGSTNNATQSFGSANSTPSFATANATPVFGSPNATPSFTTANAASPFGSTPSFTTANPPSFGSSTTPSFGTANVGLSFGASNASKPSFGGTGFTSNSGPPSFGTNSNSDSSSVFGGNTPAFSTSTGSADANRTFNFTGADPAPSPVPNLFNIGPGNPAPKGRTIRTARRPYR